MELYAFLSTADIAPIFVFVAMVAGVFGLLSALSNRNSQAEDRLDRIGRPKSLVELEMNQKDNRNRFAGLQEAFSNLGNAMEPKSDLEKNTLRVDLANAGFRSEAAPAVFRGVKLVCLGGIMLPGCAFFYFMFAFSGIGMFGMALSTALGMFMPNWILGYLKGQRQQEIFLTLPDALDLLVVCVESGLGLDAGMRKVTDEMKNHAKVMCEELALANLQLQMGRPRREVLHDLGVRTGVDDVKSLVAILIQADRFGSSIAQALRVQSDSMRTRRRQIAEEKAAKTAVKLIFPLVLFIFPAIFVVLVGPAAILIYNNLLSKM
jgi:tight adherence protein C